MDIKTNFSLEKYNTFGLDVIADNFAEFSNLDELRFIFKQINERKWYVLGGGSNTLFVKDYDGVIIHPMSNKIKIVCQDELSVRVLVDAGVIWDDFVAWSVENGFYGAENLSYIPGCVGASPVQNVGAYGVEAKDIISCVEIYLPHLDKVSIYTNQECKFGYRDSVFKNELKNKTVILRVEFVLQKKFKPNLSYGNISMLFGENEEITAHKLRNKIVKVRKEKLPDPNEIGNGGSFFKNPIVNKYLAQKLLECFPTMTQYEDAKGVKIPAGWLIEHCGWKGKCMGRAAVHGMQALVLVNMGGATPDEIVALSERIICDVRDKFGVSIEPEINFI